MLVKDFLLYRDYLNEDEINCLFSLIGTINEDAEIDKIPVTAAIAEAVNAEVLRALLKLKKETDSFKSFKEKWTDDLTKKIISIKTYELLVKKSEFNQNKISGKYNGTKPSNDIDAATISKIETIINNPNVNVELLFNSFITKEVIKNEKINNHDGIPTINSKHINTPKQDMMRPSDALKYNKG